MAAGTLQQQPLQLEGGPLPLPVLIQTSLTHLQGMLLRLSQDDQEDAGGDDNNDKNNDLGEFCHEYSRTLAGGAERSTDEDLAAARLAASELECETSHERARGRRASRIFMLSFCNLHSFLPCYVSFCYINFPHFFSLSFHS